jgi:hypothetical protein
MLAELFVHEVVFSGTVAFRILRKRLACLKSRRLQAANRERQVSIQEKRVLQKLALWGTAV